MSSMNIAMIGIFMTLISILCSVLNLLFAKNKIKSVAFLLAVICLITGIILQIIANFSK